MQIATFVNELDVLGYYLLRSFEVKTGKTNKPYIDVTLEDKTGPINAKIWNTEGVDTDEFQDIIAVKVKGKVKEYNGTLQLNIEKMRPVSGKDTVELEDLIPSAPIRGEEMYASVLEYAKRITNGDLNKLVISILEKYKEKLLYYPAAKSNHHSIRGGLLYHIKRMLETGTALCRIYGNIDPDILFSGIILHDIAKIEEMNASELGIVTEYSKEGELLGHITLGINIVHEAGKELGIAPEAVLVVKHMILSHHYEADFGSPKKPCFIEAELLHYIDMIDARVFDMDKATREISKGTFSEPVLSIERRKIYKPEL